MEADPRVLRHYELGIESERLWGSGVGELVRLRTWDIFGRELPAGGRIADVGGGPGTHATHLLGRGYEVVLVDPVPRLVDQATEATGGRARCVVGDARRLDLDDDSFDAVLLMGPLYHLPDRTDRSAALREAWRILRPGGRLLAEVITRHLWLLDGTAKGSIHDPAARARFRVNLEQGISEEPDRLADGGFYAYLHRVDEIRTEVEEAGFADTALIGVEGHAWLLGNLEHLLEEPAPLLEVLRLIESEPSLLGMSAHVIASAAKPGEATTASRR
jgi:SAM-dependent methyltransferase